jgi:hypothetical protein
MRTTCLVRTVQWTNHSYSPTWLGHSSTSTGKEGPWASYNVTNWERHLITYFGRPVTVSGQYSELSFYYAMNTCDRWTETIASQSTNSPGSNVWDTYTRVRITAFKDKPKFSDVMCQRRDRSTMPLSGPPAHFWKLISKHKSQNIVMADVSLKPEFLNFKANSWGIRTPCWQWHCVVMSLLPAIPCSINRRQ